MIAMLPQPEYTAALRAFAAAATSLVERRLRDAVIAGRNRSRARSIFQPRTDYWPDDKQRRVNHSKRKALEAAYEAGRLCDRPKDLTDKMEAN